MSPPISCKGWVKVVTMKDIAQMSIQEREKFRRKSLLQDAAKLVIEDQTRNGGRLTHGFMPFLISVLHKHGHEWMQKGMIDRAVKTLKRHGTFSIPTELDHPVATVDVAMEEAESANVISSPHPVTTVDEAMEAESPSVISLSHPATTINVAIMEGDDESASVISSFEYPYLESAHMDTTATTQLTPTGQSSGANGSTNAAKLTSTAHYIPRAKSVRLEGWKAAAKSTSTPQCIGRAKGGRPKGSTRAVMVERRKAARDEKEKAAKDERDKAVKEGQKVGYQTLRKLLKAAEEKGQLETGDSVEDTIMSRTQDKNPAATCGASTNCPMDVVEPILVEFCIRFEKTGKPMKKKEVLELAHSLISGTEFEAEYIDWLKKNSIYDPEKPLLTDNDFEGFWRRNTSYLKVDRQGYIFPSMTAGDDTEVSNKRRSDMEKLLVRANTTASKKKRFDRVLKELARCYECVVDEQENYVRCPYTEPYKTKRMHERFGYFFEAY
jgi:hypothetical protein